MARKAFRPGRTLVVFSLVVAISYGLVALGGTWKPALGLDLKGGVHLETARKLTVLALDKTGTLTEGRPQLVAQRMLATGMDEAQVLRPGERLSVEARACVVLREHHDAADQDADPTVAASLAPVVEGRQ